MVTTPVAPLEEPSGPRAPLCAGSILYIDDDATVAGALGFALQRERWQVQHVDSIAAGLDHLSAETPDLVLLDYQIPGVEGLQGLRDILAAAPDIPVVIITGHADSSIAAEAIRAGADDVIARSEWFDRNGENPATHRILSRLTQARARAQRTRGAQDLRPLLTQQLVLLRQLVNATAAQTATIDRMAAHRVGPLDRIAAIVPLLAPEQARRLVGAVVTLALAGIGYLVARIQAGSLTP